VYESAPKCQKTDEWMWINDETPLRRKLSALCNPHP